MRKHAFAWTGVALAAICSGLALAGCGAGSAVSSLVDPVAQAAKDSELAPGFRVAVSARIESTELGEAITESGTGAFDTRSGRGVFTTQLSAEGHAITAEAEYTRQAVYVRLPSGVHTGIPAGKRWIEVDIADVEGAFGVSSSPFESQATSDPREVLSYLRAAGSVRRLGSQDVRGETETHYRARIDYARLAAAVAPGERAAARQSAAALQRLTGASTQAVEVWVGAQHRVRREAFALDECLDGQRIDAHMSIEYLDFGAQAMPAPPASSEVDDITAKVISKLGDLDLGCS